MAVLFAASISLYCPFCGTHAQPNAEFCHSCGAMMPDISGQPSLSNLLLSRAVRYAGIGERMLAMLIDWVVVNSLVWPSSFVVGWLISVSRRSIGIRAHEAGVASGFLAVVVWIVADWLYSSLMISSPRQATYGKQWMHLKVTNLDGQRIPFLQATGRHFAKFLSTFMLLGGFVMAAFTKHKQALHDLAAGTVVVKAD